MVVQRLKEYIDAKGITIAAFEKSIGMSNASFGKSLKNGGAIGSDKLEKILTTYPDLSPTWLLTGQGSMDNDDPANFVRPGKPIGEFSALIDTIREQAIEIGQLRERIAQLERRLQKDASDVLTSTIANVG